MPTSPSACQETSHWPRAEERKAEERMVLQNYAFTVSSLLPRLLLHWPTKKCSPLSQSTKYTDSSTVETTPRAPGRSQNQSRSALKSARLARGRGSPMLKWCDAMGVGRVMVLPTLTVPEPAAGCSCQHCTVEPPAPDTVNVRGGGREASKAAEEGVPIAATSSSSCSVSTSPVLPRIQGA